MIVEMPFLQKSTGRSPNRSDIREIVSFDKDTMDIAEFALSDFDPGTNLGNGIGTLHKAGRHWAYFGTAVTGCLDYRPLDAHGRARAMRDLSLMINTTRFFDDGRMKLKINRVMSAPLPSRWIESTERETNLARLREWVADNVAMIDGHLAIRVGEPSLRLTTSEPDKQGTCALWIMREKLLPDLAHYNPGLHFSLDDRDTMQQIAIREVNANPQVDSWKVMLESGVIERMEVGFQTDENMYERTLRSLAAAVVGKGPRGKNVSALQHHFDHLDTLDDMPTGQTDDVELDRMMGNLVTVSHNIHPSTSILVGMAAARWEDRPVALAMDLGQRSVTP
jgi:hypothetical protein|nr:hypothetical protein [Neorhizobium tomejilense]